MENRKLEVLILTLMKEENPNFQVKPFSDFKFGKKMTLPRIVSRTMSNKIVEKYKKRIDLNKAIYKQIEIHRHVIQLTFILSKNESSEDVENLKRKFTHEIGIEWYFARKGINIVIEEVTPTVDISSFTNDGYTEKYTFDIIIRSEEENIAEIEHIKKVEYAVNVRNRR